MNSQKRLNMERRISESGEEMCPVCSEVIKIFAVGECDHPVCFKCSTRMRVLCNQMYCAICRTDIPKVAFSREFSKFENLKLANFKLHQKHKIFFENEAVKTCFFEIQEHRCNRCKSRKVLPTFHLLTDHMRKEHSLYPCDICVKHIKLFSSERKFYDRKRLGEHRRVGDSDDKSHKGHPLCEFCDVRYLDNDELARHLRKDHFYCHFCDADGVSNAFYDHYGSLKEHFKQDHFLCEEGECAGVQFTNAFRFELDLKAHVAAFHSKNLKRAMAKAVRTLDIDFNVAPRGGSSRGRGRRGVINRRDFEEVASAEDPQPERVKGFGRGKDFKRERRQQKLEEENVARAINASLNTATQTSISVVDPSLLQSSTETAQGSEEVSADLKYNRRSEDFPTLGGNIVHEHNSEEGDPDGLSSQNPSHSDSLAKKVARANRFDVQDGGMEYEDFPHLGPSKTKTNPVPLQSRKVVQSGWMVMDDDFPDLGGGGGGGGALNKPVWKPPSKQSKVVASQTQKKSSHQLSWNTSSGTAKNHNKGTVSNVDSKSVTDYPSLSSIGSFLSKGASSGSASDALDKYASAGVSNAFQKSNVQLIQTKPDFSPPSQRASNAPVVYRKNENTLENDFPSLSGSKGSGGSTVSNSWGPKQKSKKAEIVDAKSENDGLLKMKKKNKKNAKKDSYLTENASEESTDSMKSMKNGSMKKSESVNEAALVYESGTPNNFVHSGKETNSGDNNKSSLDRSLEYPSLSSISSSLSQKTVFTSKSDVNDNAKDDTLLQEPFENDFPSLGKATSAQPSSSNWRTKDNPQKTDNNKTGSKGKKKSKKSQNPDPTSIPQTVPSESSSDSIKYKENVNGSDTGHQNANSECVQSKDAELEFAETSALKPKSKKKSKAKKESKQELSNAGETKTDSVLKSMENGSAFPSIHDTSVEKIDEKPIKEPVLTLQNKETSVTQQQFNENEDFPALSGGISKPPPPPGFNKKSSAPPGFNANSVKGSMKPPPGFKSSNPPAVQGLSGIAALLSNNNENTFHTKVEETPVTDEILTTYEYIKPSQFQERNCKLINDIVNILGDEKDKFLLFKTLSGNFRKGIMEASDYYRQCSDVMGVKNFGAVFPELLVLLPDIEKQQQLLLAHNEVKKSVVNTSKGKKAWKSNATQFLSCQICQQVVSPIEMSIHLEEHHLDSDFPALGSSSGIKAS